MGRHGRALAARGYIVTAIEREPLALAVARERGGGPVYIQADMREYSPEAAAFDAVIILSQSFGYFDSETNRRILCRLSDALRPGGRMILDLWNPDFFRSRQGEHRFELSTGTVRETKRMAGDRLFTRLEYSDGGHDDFEFQTFTPAQMAQYAESADLNLNVACTDFSGRSVPSPDNAKVQYVLERL
jgi:SAM-dependent methyltransferase